VSWSMKITGGSTSQTWSRTQNGMRISFHAAAGILTLAALGLSVSASAGDASSVGRATTPLYKTSNNSAGANSAASPVVTASPSPVAPLPLAKTILVPESTSAAPDVGRRNVAPRTTTEIPQSVSNSQDDDAAPGTDTTGPVVSYEKSQNPEPIQPQLRSLQEFISYGDNTSPLGMEVREGQRQLKSGEAADGLLIVEIVGGSPAAQAGLRAYRHLATDLLQAGSVAAALIFPPAVLAVPIFEQVHVGDSYDLIIGVDGNRVTNFLDFEDRMREVQPGEIVYLSIVRNGERMQILVHVPTTLSPPEF
jgi:hypothetical protein